MSFFKEDRLETRFEELKTQNGSKKEKLKYKGNVWSLVENSEADLDMRQNL